MTQVMPWGSVPESGLRWSASSTGSEDTVPNFPAAPPEFDAETQLAGLYALLAASEQCDVRMTPEQRRPRLIALLPAHDEEDGIGAAISGLRAQYRPPNEIVVVADNCTDRTGAIAKAAGAFVITTHGNHDKKAGALNQGLAMLMPPLRDTDMVLIADADTILHRRFIGAALRRLAHTRNAGGCGGTVRVDHGGGILGLLQRAEYARFARSQLRARRPRVLSGAGCIFRVAALRDVAAAREDGRLPGREGVYNPVSLTEDAELCLALRTLRWSTVVTGAASMTTEVMTRWPDLATQRIRWQRGAIDDLRAYGFTRVTGELWAVHAFLYIMLMVTVACYGAIVISVISGQEFSPLWAASTAAVSVVSRCWTARRAGGAAVVLAASLIPETFNDLVRGICHIRALADSLSRRTTEWQLSRPTLTPNMPVTIEGEPCIIVSLCP